jgi:hypothetical protein
MYFTFDQEAIESKAFSGFYRIPLPNCDYSINRNGTIVNEITGNTISTQVAKEKNYRVVTMYVGFPKRKRTFAVHRMVALIFVEKPERHKDIPYSELQVNHKNGDKENNGYRNLEWVTNEENMKHARESDLFDNEKAVLARNVGTDEVIEFKSISECARWLCMRVTALSVHLRSVCAGMIEKEGYVFKFKDDKDWPERISYDKDTTTLHHVADVIAENVETGKKFLCKNLLHAITHVGFTRNQVMNHRARAGHDVPYKGWIFYQFRPAR